MEMILLRLLTRYTGSAADGTTATLTLYLLGLLAGAALVLKLNEKYQSKMTLMAIASFLLLSLSTPILGLLSAHGDWTILSASAGNNYAPTVLIVFLMAFLPATLAGTSFPLLILINASFLFWQRKVL